MEHPAYGSADRSFPAALMFYELWPKLLTDESQGTWSSDHHMLRKSRAVTTVIRYTRDACEKYLATLPTAPKLHQLYGQISQFYIFFSYVGLSLYGIGTSFCSKQCCHKQADNC